MRKSDVLGEFGKLETNQGFGEHISGHLVCAPMFESNYTSIECFTNVVVSDCNVFGVRVKSRVFHKLDSGLVVAVDDDRAIASAQSIN